ncbi:hypothetical protein D3C72_1304610 [compost metagenome]
MLIRLWSDAVKVALAAIKRRGSIATGPEIRAPPNVMPCRNRFKILRRAPRKGLRASNNISDRPGKRSTSISPSPGRKWRSSFRRQLTKSSRSRSRIEIVALPSGVSGMQRP